MLRGSLLLESSFLSCGNENDQLIQVGHTYKLSVHVSAKVIDVCACALRNSVKMEMFKH